VPEIESKEVVGLLSKRFTKTISFRQPLVYLGLLFRDERSALLYFFLKKDIIRGIDDSIVLIVRCGNSNFSKWYVDIR
jgi:hypothetical protein